MENVELTFPDEALSAVAKKAIERKTGARGLRSIMEGILLDTMFDLPASTASRRWSSDQEVVEGKARPLYIYAERAAQAKPAQAPDARTIWHDARPRSEILRRASVAVPAFRRLLDTPPRVAT